MYPHPFHVILKLQAIGLMVAGRVINWIFGRDIGRF